MSKEAFKRLSDEKIEEAIASRESFFKFFDDNGIKYAAGNISKPYIGILSPGCQTCVDGTWSCVYFNVLCTKSCFYCPQDRAQIKERFPKTDDHLLMESTDDYVEYLKVFPFKGIGFSGGEPLLQIDKLVEYIKAIRTEFGSNHYIWVYTNGDLVTEEKVKLLDEAGINELRFNISTSNYNVEPVALAAKCIDTVTIEIPAIPEDLDIVKSKLKDFEAAGVKHLNIHQLLINKYNQDEFVKRGYTITNPDYYKEGKPVLESEIVAFEILKHATTIGINMGVNYCSRCYKTRFQETSYQRRHASVYKSEEENMTRTGFLRKFETRRNGNASLVSAERLADIANGSYDEKISVVYDKLKVKPASEKNDKNNQSVSIGNTTGFLGRERALDCELSNKTSVVFFHKLFIEKKNFSETLEDVADLFGLGSDDMDSVMADIKAFYKQFEILEYIQEGLQPYN